MKILIYDCEIIKAVPDANKVNLGHIEYCKGWDDFENMGISVIGANFISKTGSGVYAHTINGLGINVLSEFQVGLDNTDALVGFNNQHFDDNLIKANGFNIPDNIINYDILAEIWEGAGLGRVFVYPTHAGFSLGAICEANGIGSKTGTGANAAILWQQGKEQEVIDYCINDIKLTRELFDLIQDKGEIIDPRINNCYFKKYNPEFEFKPIKVKRLEELLGEVK